MTDHVVDMHTRRRCKRCNRRIVKRDYNQPIPVVSVDEKGVQTTDVMTQGMVVCACPACDFGASA